MTYLIYGNPIPLKRHRTCKGKTYNPQSKEMESFGWNVKFQMMESREKITQQAIKLTLAFYMPIPKALSKKQQELLVNSPHGKKPDLSNLIKFVEDALNGILWTDDSVICNIDAKKVYSREPKTVISIVN